MRSRSDALRSYICLLSRVNIGYLFAMLFQYPLATTAPGGQTFQFVGLPKSELNKFSEWLILPSLNSLHVVLVRPWSLRHLFTTFTNQYKGTA